jgi:hypothetical protein
VRYLYQLIISLSLQQIILKIKATRKKVIWKRICKLTKILSHLSMTAISTCLHIVSISYEKIESRLRLILREHTSDVPVETHCSFSYLQLWLCAFDGVGGQK